MDLGQFAAWRRPLQVQLVSADLGNWTNYLLYHYLNCLEICINVECTLRGCKLGFIEIMHQLQPVTVCTFLEITSRTITKRSEGTSAPAGTHA